MIKTPKTPHRAIHNKYRAHKTGILSFPKQNKEPP